MAGRRPSGDMLDWLGLTATPRWHRARLLGRLLGLAFALLLVLALVAAVHVLLGAIRSPGAGGLGAGALIVAILGAPFLIWSTVLKHRTVGFQKESHLTDRISKAVEQLGAEKTVRRALLDDGDAPRVDTDGKPVTTEETVPNIEVRIGGLLSLERIAQDSTAYDRGRDHVRVMEILCAYIRENARARKVEDHPYGEWEPLKDDATAEERAEHLRKREERFGREPFEGKVRAWAQDLRPPRGDVALALTILGRRTPEQRRIEARWGPKAAEDADWVFDPPLPDRARDAPPLGKAALDALAARYGSYAGYRPDLRGTNLQGADLSGHVLCGVELAGARMEGAGLSGARMEGANLSGARMEGSNLVRARMVGAVLAGARMEGTNLCEARMDGAKLSKTRMEGAVLFDARMEGADLSVAGMERADLSGARAEEVNFSEARMEGTNFFAARVERADFTLARMEGAALFDAQMEGADLFGARMEGTNLGAARMQRSNLMDARIEGANLRGAGMEGAAFFRARMDDRTDLDAAAFRGAALRNVDYSSVPISPDQVGSAFGDASVTLPGGVTPGHPDWPARWPVWSLPDSDRHGGPTFAAEWRRWQADPAAYVPPPPPAGSTPSEEEPTA